MQQLTILICTVHQNFVLLDPRLKEMRFANDEIDNNTIYECREQLYQLTQLSTEEII